MLPRLIRNRAPAAGGPAGFRRRGADSTAPDDRRTV